MRSKVKGIPFGVVGAFRCFGSPPVYIRRIAGFMVSMLGTPPMLGFLGKLSVINYLIIQGSYVFIGLILTALLLLAYAFLNVIKAVYFDSLTNVFDRADKGVYICLMINLILVLISILNPKYLMHDAEAILSTVL